MPAAVSDPFIDCIRKVSRPLEELTDFREEGLRPAAVLFSFVKMQGQWHVLFIHRAEKGEFHRGEVAFPGGGRENQDKTLLETALRETNEELGISQTAITPLGFMAPMPTISRYWVTPILAVIEWPVSTQIEPEEVKHFFTIPYAWLADTENWQEHVIKIPGRGEVLTIDYSLYKGEHLWGITARITNTLVELLKKKSDC